MRHFILFLGICFFLTQGCSVVQSFHFNKDFSGDYSMEIDMSQLLAMSAMFDTTGTADPDQMMTELAYKLDSVDMASKYNDMAGIDNAAVIVENSSLKISYDFQNVDAFNKSFGELDGLLGEAFGDDVGQDMNMGDLGLNSKVTPLVVNKKTLTYTMTDETPSGMDMPGDTPGTEEMSKDEMQEMMNGLGDMFELSTHFSFDRKIKKAESSGFILSDQDKNNLKAKFDMANMPEGPTRVIFKLK